MAFFDNTTRFDYIEVDEDFFGDGQTDETTLPLSAYKDGLIENNNRCINQTLMQGTLIPRRDPEARTPQIVTGLEGGQGEGAEGLEGVCFFAPVRIPVNSDKVRMDVTGIVDTEGDDVGSASPTVQAKLSVLVNNGSYFKTLVVGKENWNYREGDTSTYTVDAMLYDNLETYINQEHRKVWICLSIVSMSQYTGGEDPYTTLEEEWYQQDEGLANLGMMIKKDTFDYNPTEAASVKFLEHNYQGSDSDAVYMGEGLTKVAYDTDTEDLYMIMRAPRYPRNDNTDPTLSPAFLSYLIPRSFTLSVEKDPSVRCGRYQPKGDADIYPQRPVGGAESVQHVQNSRFNYERWRIAGMGPSSLERGNDEDRPGDNWDLGPDWYEQWARTRADKGDELLAFETFRLDHAENEIAVDASFFGAEIYIWPGRYTDDDEDPGTPPNRFSEGDYNPSNTGSDGDGFYKSFRITWPINITIRQMKDGSQGWGDADVIKEVTEEPEFLLWMPSWRPDRPVLRNLLHTFYDQIDTNKSISEEYFVDGQFNATIASGRWSISSPDTDAERDKKMGMKMIEPLTIRMDISEEDNLDPDLPVLLEITADAPTDLEHVNEDVETGVNLDDVRDYIHLWLTSYTVHTRGV